ncbi:PAS sensor protein (plasmid) [Gemmatirosa kalamazoonensis]|uniref:histidine kinase n=1 Tax=Gemmatirosa kalamazoonensis TaxID=861299 RepID=W0RRP8_9BACT|nr:PAS domain-containing protein [Gemmatirosa kalamazoonensis]AHG92243.1 PAS sensor protein [Gemmatirosa kalamazoonensis]
MDSSQASGDGANLVERRARTTIPRRALDAQVAAVLESVTHGFLALDAEWRVTYANPAAVALSGAPPDALVGRIHWDVWPETCGTEVEARYRAVVAERRSAHFEHHYPGRDVWHEIHAFPTVNGGLAVVYRDITEERAAAATRARYAAALAARERELSVILETATDAVLRFDRELRVTFANPAVTRVTGIPADALLGHTPDMLGLPADIVARCTDRLRALLASSCSDEPLSPLTFELDTPSGRRWFEAQTVLEPDADDRPKAVLVVARDITPRVRAEQATAHALAAAEAANRAKAEFLATMSHELRTPLNAIRGYTELIALGVHGPVTDAQRECLERIARSERHLLELITDILDYARIEAGRVAYESSAVALRPLIQDVCSWMERNAQAKGVVLDSDLRPVDVCGDPKRVRQIVVNLLTNAIKFTPPGGRVTLRSAPVSENPADGGVVEVTDTGPGIPPAEQERVFLPFVQLDRGRQNPIGGVGLGLAISREFARGMGGDLRLRSVPNDGSTFTLQLPGPTQCA